MVDRTDADVPAVLRDATGGYGPDSVIDAVGMEAHGSRMAATAQGVVGMVPDALAKPLAQRAGLDRLSALYECIETVRRGGTVSVSGVYGGALDPMPMMTIFDKGHVRAWTDDLPLLNDGDPLGVMDLASHHLPLEEAPHGYEVFQKKAESCVKVILEP